MFEGSIEKISFQHKGDSTNEHINHFFPDVIQSGETRLPAASITSPIVKCLLRDIAQGRDRLSFRDTDGNKNVYFTAATADLSSRVLCREFVLGGLNIHARVPRKRHAGTVGIYLNALHQS